MSGYSACGCFDLVRLLGGSGTILERDEAGIEDFSVDQLQVDVGSPAKIGSRPVLPRISGNTVSRSRSTILASKRPLTT